jgi:hypothetical protein
MKIAPSSFCRLCLVLAEISEEKEAIPGHRAGTSHHEIGRVL